MSDEFSFGTLATDELRLKQIKDHRTGLVHLNRTEPLDPRPGQPVRLLVTTGGGFVTEQVTCRYTTDGSDPGLDGAATLHFEAGQKEWDTFTWSYLTTWKAVIPPQVSGVVVRYQITAVPLHQSGFIYADGKKEFRFDVSDNQAPAWSREAILYQLFIDRFYPGNGKAWADIPTPAGFYGGTLAGILEKLDYLQDLGVNCIWLSPCYPSPSHHGYDVTDLFQVEPRLGTIADLRLLVETAHQRRIRVLLDFVANHCSDRHPYFVSARNDPGSPYRDWFVWKRWPEDYQSFFDVPEMPDWNLENPATRQYILDAASFWVQECDIDGYRLDYAYGPSHEFWLDFRRCLRKIKPDLWLIGEIVESPELQRSFSGRMDGTLDFMLCQAFRAVFATGSQDVAALDAFLHEHEAYFPACYSLPSFLDNHDVNRFLWIAGNDKRRLKLAALCQFSLPGAPIIYYGTEVGLSQERDVRQNGLGLLEESRLPMLWDGKQDQDLLDFYQRLIRLRKTCPAIWRGEKKVWVVDGKRGVYIYSREMDGDVVVVAMNLGEVEQCCTIPIVADYDALAGEELAVDPESGVEIWLAPWQGRLLVRKQSDVEGG